MATTTNYGWETPDDTDLVKDGAAAIRTLGSSVDTTTKALNPSTTLGDIEYRSSTANTNTRLAIGSTGNVLTVAGGVPTWAAPSDQTPLTTKGDLFTFSTIDARLGVGANNTVLTADSSEATGMKWASPVSGGMTLINTGGTALTGASVTISSIPSTYNMLYLMIEGFGTAQDGTVVFATFNGDTNSRYSYFSMGTAEADQAFSNTKIQLFPNQDDGTDDGFSYTILPNYTSTTSWKMAQTWSMGNWYTTSSSVRVANFSGFYNQTTAISSIELFQNGGYNFDAGTAYLYGVK